ncbi:Mu transposase domain-containing protein [Nocardia nova]|uniref:Mu transposase domain-containing protein n=1 Tax=Nocardia nova TaxID=37330 RepID=UPI003F69642D
MDPTVIGRMVDVHADLDTVTARCDGAVVAAHPRAWTRHRTITDPARVETAARLRATFQHCTAATDSSDGEAGLVRNLADYDARFGVDFDGEGVA